MKRKEMLLQRSRRCRCRYCGGKLSLKRIVYSEFEDARLELYCEDCQRLEFGVENDIYDVAKYFVESLEFNCYPNFPDNNHTKQMNIAKVCEILSLGCRQLGLLGNQGFFLNSNNGEKKIGKCVVLKEDDLGADMT